MSPAFEWDEQEGSGYVRNFLPDGKQLLTFFGRYQGDDKEYVHGLFVDRRLDVIDGVMRGG